MNINYESRIFIYIKNHYQFEEHPLKIYYILITILLLSTSLFAEINTTYEDFSQMSLLELMDIKITTAGKTSEKVSDIPASVVIITREEIAQNGYQTLHEILENTLGMYPINDYNVLGTDMGVRGHKSARANENIIFMVNGVNQTNDMYKNNPLNQIIVPVEAIDKIEIVRGPMSVIYGSGAFFGAINIITNDSGEKKPVNIASASYGSFNSKKAFVRFEDKIADLHFSLNGSVYNDDGMVINYDDISSIPPGIHDGTTKNNMAKLERYFNLSGRMNAVYFNMSFANSENHPFVNYPLSKNAPAIITSTGASFGIKKQVTEIVKFDGKISFSNYQEEVISDYFDSAAFTHYELFKTNTYETDLNTFIKPNSSIDITGGIYYRYSPDVSIRIHAPSEGMPGTQAEITDGQKNEAVYSQVNFRPMDKLQLTAGLRAERKEDYNVDIVFNSGPAPWLVASKVVEDNKIHLISRFAAIYQLNENHHFKFLYGEAIKQASFHLSITSLYMPHQPLLDPENIKTFEINYLGKLSPKISTNISLFNNRMNNLISRVSGVDEEGHYYQYDSNKGELITYGAEATIILQPIETLSIRLSGQYQQTNDMNNDDLTPSFSPNYLAYFQGSYNFMENGVVSVTGRYVSEMESYWDVSRTNDDPDNLELGYIGDKIDGYFTLNSNLRFSDLMNYGLFVNIKVSNLLDTEFRYPTTSEVTWANKGYSAPGRTYFISIGREF